jgi:hypothetical protein
VCQYFAHSFLLLLLNNKTQKYLAMKKIILLLIVTLSLVGFSNAQSYHVMTSVGTDGVTQTTFSNADTAYAYAPVRSLKAASFAATVAITQNTGTTGGSITWQGSVNGLDWFTLQTATTISGSTVSGYSVTGVVPYNRYRALIITSGTQTSTLTRASYYYKL